MILFTGEMFLFFLTNLEGDSCMLYSVFCIIYYVFHSAFCILYHLFCFNSAFCILYSAFCILYHLFCFPFCILYSVFCILYSVFCILYSVSFILFSILHSVFCILYGGGLVQLHFPPNPSPAVLLRRPLLSSIHCADRKLVFLNILWKI